MQTATAAEQELAEQRLKWAACVETMDRGWDRLKARDRAAFAAAKEELQRQNAELLQQADAARLGRGELQGQLETAAAAAAAKEAGLYQALDAARAEVSVSEAKVRQRRLGLSQGACHLHTTALLL